MPPSEQSEEHDYLSAFHPFSRLHQDVPYRAITWRSRGDRLGLCRRLHVEERLAIGNLNSDVYDALSEHDSSEARFHFQDRRGGAAPSGYGREEYQDQHSSAFHPLDDTGLASA